MDYLSKVKLEFSKVKWLSRKELSQLVLTVFVITLLTAGCFAIIDMISSSLIMKIIFW